MAAQKLNESTICEFKNVFEEFSALLGSQENAIASEAAELRVANRNGFEHGK